MYWATFEEITAPIVNNDYRFGLSITGIKYLNKSFLKNISFKVTPFAHESTHIGDELTIYGMQNITNFFRVNVSYEYENESKADREWNINALIGYDFVPKRTKVIKSVGHYFRFYSGLNPHGQFRNMYYRFMGYSIVLFY